MKKTILVALIIAVVAPQSVLTKRAAADIFGSGANQFTIDFVTIGNPGNSADTSGNPDSVGSVPYAYRIGKYEISRNMIEKANAQGGLGITQNPMSFVPGGPRADMPAMSVSWNEAARFVNWLNTSQGFPAVYKFVTQPGSPGYSANANIQLWVAGDAGFDASNPFRNSQARFFLPNVHEWYKAAFYDPNRGTGGYWDYPTGSDVEPAPVASGTAAGTAVYDQSLSQGPADITIGGGLSPYGTMAQGGNVPEWEETEWDLVNNVVSAVRGYRQSAWDVRPIILSAPFRSNDFPDALNDVGFRVASVPEPGTGALGLWAAVGLTFRTWGRARRGVPV
jgi:formylglycine-generating enzyme required for sulfatase activity